MNTNATQREKAEMLKQDAMIRRKGDEDKTTGNEPTTYSALTNVDLALEGGRFGAQRVVGSTPDAGAVFPQLPASSP